MACPLYCCAVEVIVMARVLILKFKSKANSKLVDLTFSQKNRLKATKMVHKYLELHDGVIRAVIYKFRGTLNQHDLAAPSHACLGLFALVNLIGFVFLRLGHYFPCEFMSPVAVLKIFCDLYDGTSIKVIDFATTGVSINNGDDLVDILEKFSCEHFRGVLHTQP